MNKSYEIRFINGQEVFVKNIVGNFWLFNDIYADFCDDYKVTDDVIVNLFSLKDDPYTPYMGAKSGYVLGQFKVDDEYAMGEYPLDAIEDASVREKARLAYEEYKKLDREGKILRRRTREEIKADVDARRKRFREEKEKLERGESLSTLQKRLPEKCMLHPNGFHVNSERLAMMTEEEKIKEYQRIDDLNRRLKIHRDHMTIIRENHRNPKSIEDAILTEEESAWLKEDAIFIKSHPFVKNVFFDENNEKDQEYKAMLVEWFKTEDGQQFIENITNEDMIFLKNYFSDEELNQFFRKEMNNYD